MKSMNDDNHGNSTSNNNNSWLGFSLSAPHHHQQQPQHQYLDHHQHPHHHHQGSSTVDVSNAAATTNFFLTPHLLNTSAGLCYGFAENGAFHTPLSVMPLKSDGSLCIMEALTRSQHQQQGDFYAKCEGLVPNTSPKLEDFLGVESHHQYGSHDREIPSLDSMFYHQSSLQQEEPSSTRPEHQSPQNFFQQHQYFSGLGSCQEIYQETPVIDEGEANKEEETQDLVDCDTSPPMGSMGEDGHVGVLPCRAFGQHQLIVHTNMGDHVATSGSVSAAAAMGCGDLQSLTLSMSPGSQSSCVTASTLISPSGTETGMELAKKRGPAKATQKHRKSLDTFGQRTSQYRGVTRHRWTGRYEAHLWDNTCKKEGQTRKGRQVYLGGYDMEEKAARAYDLAALKYWGASTHINFPLENYRNELEDMKNMNRQEFVAHLRRKSSGFSRGASMYRGVTRHHQHGRWQARIGRVAGNKDLYLGTFSTQEEAAEAYDIAAIKFRGVNAVTNFDISRYDVERIMSSNSLLAGELARRNKDVQVQPSNEASYNAAVSQNSEEGIQSEDNTSGSVSEAWKMALFQSAQQQQHPSNACVETAADHQSAGIGAYRDSTFPLALHDLIGIDSGSSRQQMSTDDSAKLGGAHFSNSSSLVTSLGSSREGSPDRTAPSATVYGSKYINAGAPVSSWIPRPAAAISMAHLPVFAAWNDA